MHIKMKIIVTFLLTFCASFAVADGNASIIKLDLPLFDLPYQVDAMNTVGNGFFSSYANPSMKQSLSVTTNIYSAAHFGLRKMYDNWRANKIIKSIVYYGGIGFVDIFALYVPGGQGWMHEEYHRSIMSRYQVNSFNMMNTFPIGKAQVYVKNVKDEDLERFKSESPVDFIRMHEAGGEGELLLVDSLQRNNFFYQQNLPNEFVSWLAVFDVWQYIFSAYSPFTDNPDLKNETTIAERDFTGHDYTSWVYDLFRPNEPYNARGTHPSGTGIDRYIKSNDLSDEEMSYIKKQSWWTLANLVSPMMIGFKTLPWFGTDIRWNFAFRHFCTSFGTDLSFNLFLDIDKFNFVVVYHNYQNYKYYFPAIEIEMLDYLMTIDNFVVHFSPRIALGIQPKKQGFSTSEIEFFGLFGSRFDFQINKNWLPYFEFIAKTDGWVAGNEFLGRNISCILGISARF